jgi:flagellar hook-associated protein 3 FlgL
MRIATRTIYELQNSELSNLTIRMTNTSEQVSTGKRINELADDPAGLSRVLDFKSGKDFLDQVDSNIENGKIWLNSGETSLDSIEDITLSMKTLALKMKNDAYNADQREEAAGQVNAALQELINLANTQVMGKYLYSGTRTDTQPIVADNLSDPSRIIYNGDQSGYRIKISSQESFEVGQVGSEIFWEDTVTIDSTNNKIDFREYIEGGYQVANVKAGEVIDTENVSVDVKNYAPLDKPTENLKPLQFMWNKTDEVWEVKNDPGYGLPSTLSGTSSAFDVDMDLDGFADIEVRLSQAASDEDYVEFDLVPHETVLEATLEDGVYTKEELATEVKTAMTRASLENGYKVEYDTTYDDVTGKYSINYLENSIDGYFKVDFQWASGSNSYRSAGPELGFDVIDSTYEPAISDNRLGQIIQAGVNDTLEFSVDGGATTHVITVPPGKYSNEDLAEQIETEMKNAVGNVDFDKNFDVRINKKDVRFEFDASETSLPPGSFQILWNTGPSALGNIIGFNTNIDDVGSLEYQGRSLTEKVDIQEGVNDKIDFVVDGTNYTITIPDGEYSNEDLTSKIEELMDKETGLFGFDLSFDGNNHSFSIDATATGAAAFDVLWNTGPNAATSTAELLGFPTTADSNGALNYTGAQLYLTTDIIAGVNDRINFRELPQDGKYSPELSFTIDPGTYTNDELAAFMEFQMEQQSSAEGYNIDYTVDYDSMTHQFKFRENGSQLDEIQFLWNSGTDRPVSEGGTGRNAALTLGFDESEDHSAVLTGTSDERAEWGLFDTLISMKEYLRNNDTDGLNRTLTRLDHHYNEQLGEVTDIGMRMQRLETKQTVNSEITFSMEENRAKVEEVDMVKALMDLNSIEVAYKASLSASAKVLKISLADYL